MRSLKSVTGAIGMLVKGLGCILVLFACTAFAVNHSRGFASRVRELESLQGLTDLLEGEVCYALNPLAVAFANISRGKQGTARIFSTAASILEKRTGQSAGEAFRLSLRQEKATLHLSREDYTALEAFADGLGMCDLQTQQNSIQMLKKRLELQTAEARENCKKYRKLYNCLGVLAGVFIILILI